MRSALFALFVAFGPGCQLVTDFELDPVAEDRSELCADGRDNDFDGLTDCQDFGCVEVPRCCDIREEVIAYESFTEHDAACGECPSECGEASCAPDQQTWHTWLCPPVKLCEGGLRPAAEAVNCSPSGIVSRAELPVEPGLRVTAEFAGFPGRQGSLEVGLTLRAPEEFPVTYDPCGTSILDVETFAAMSIEGTGDGQSVRVVARLRDQEVGSLRVAEDLERPREAAIAIENDGRVTYSLDGVEIARSPDPLPPSDRPAHLVLSGKSSLGARFLSTSAVAGRSCHTPGSFRLAGEDVADSEVLAPGETLGAWDGYEVFQPAPRYAGGEVELYYSGCDRMGFICNRFAVGLGRALESDPEAGSFLRDPAEPILLASEIGSFAPHEHFSAAVLEDSDEAFLARGGRSLAIHRLSLEGGASVGDAVLSPGPAGSWEGELLCCPTAVRRGGRTYLWYAGLSSERTGFAIGLAIAEEGGAFRRVSSDPVVSPGAPGGFDSSSVSHPHVLWDESRSLFRMWYQGTDFYGRTSIGYAVSTDGVEWIKAPENPVLAPEELGFASVGGPAVLRRANGSLRMWIEGTTPADGRRRIFELENPGTPIQEE